ncbi:ExbD/TolR family protein [Celeribacter neptunius]|uniref:Biopolymer transport protein ExbD n=1 Tax=Celeribacter neptunius TaxID=588602 RepID=A0A1I3WU26_9RHOB|nr:biopolymer transporter ExbD [Celeribacter neptunius]SFK11018.1 biopolymer transport protein ExbD [Celeribacter neptunius]
MEFSEPPRKSPVESVVPMINVVFLLLIFFLMAARIAPPDALDVDLPEAAGLTEVEAELPLYLGRDGTLAFRDAQGREAALKALSEARETLCATAAACPDETGPRVALHADREVAARTVAALLPELARLGFQRVEVITRQGGGQ